MFGPRRYLPSIPSLLALEAVDRLGSATAAAEELALTHSAVSRQIKVLEGQIGVALVERDGNRLRLTPAAREYCARVRDLLADLSRSTLTLRANPTGGSLNLAILPAFGLHWLAPRLGHFAERHPEVTVNLTTRLSRFDFKAEKLDAALHYGTRDWVGVNYLALVDEHVMPVCAASFLVRPAEDAGTLASLPLLHLETRPWAWEEWFRAHGITASNLSGMLCDQFSTLAQAAVHGMGLALLPDYIARPEIERGRLVAAWDTPMITPGRYYLVWPDREPVRPQVLTFVTWMAETVRGEAAAG